MNKTKKAQITTFVIIGLVLLIVFIIFLALRRTAKPETQRIQEILNELETGSIKNHITNCVVQIAMDGIERIGANGGVIYDSEGGKIPFNDKVLGENYLNYTYLNQPFFVAYALRENTLYNKIVYEAPGYPYPDTPLDGLNSIYNSDCLYNPSCSAYDGFYGQNVMSKLCYLAHESGCEGFATGIEIGLTIQRQLEDYVATKLPMCVDFSAFTSRMPADVRVEEELGVEAKPVVEANIHESEVVFLVKYPIRISFENQEPVTKVLNYQTTLKVRLGLMYNFLHNALLRDSKLIEFNINNEYILSSYYSDGLELSKINNPCTTCPLPYIYDDIIEVRDTKSLVKGKSFLFRVAVMNRKPALDLIDDVSLDVSDNIQLKAFDPDDSDVTYMFLSQEPGGCWQEEDYEIQINPDTVFLSLHIDEIDVGNHNMGILVLDDSGLFDYQKFWINKIGLPAASTLDTTCLLIDCSSQYGTDCIDKMPNCFWVRNASGEACYDVNSLDTITHPAYIIIS